MTRTFKRIVGVAILFIAIAAGAVALVMSGGCSADTAASSPVGEIANGALNTVIDASGVKGRIDSLLREKAGSFANQLGVPESVAEGIVDSLAIEDWQVTSLPADAAETSTSTIQAENVSATVTTYEDPSYITVEAYGVSLTMSVPESAQLYTPYLQYLQYLPQQ